MIDKLGLLSVEPEFPGSEKTNLEFLQTKPREINKFSEFSR